jgi:hypothetical protein
MDSGGLSIGDTERSAFAVGNMVGGSRSMADWLMVITHYSKQRFLGVQGSVACGCMMHLVVALNLYLKYNTKIKNVGLIKLARNDIFLV